MSDMRGQVVRRSRNVQERQQPAATVPGLVLQPVLVPETGHSPRDMRAAVTASRTNTMPNDGTHTAAHN